MIPNSKMTETIFYLRRLIIRLIATFENIQNRPMSKKLNFKGHWNNGSNRIQCQLPLIIFEEEGNIIAYCPPLDLSGYGEDEREARKSWETALDTYFNYTLAKGSLARDLKKLGWIIKKSVRKKMIPPKMSYLLENNEDFKDIFNNHDYKKTNTTVDIPELA